MILLQSYDRYDDLLELDFVTGAIRFLSRAKEPQLASETIRGMYSTLCSDVVLLYRRNDRLFLRARGQDIEVDDTTAFVLKRAFPQSRLTVVRGGNALFQWDYETPIPVPPLADDPTPFVEEEDFDFGLFLSHVTADPDRKTRLFQ